MKAFYQGNYLHNIVHKINFLWLMTEDFTILIRYDRLMSGLLRIMDFTRYPADYLPIHEEGDFKEAEVSDVEEVLDYLDKMVRQVKEQQLEFNPTSL